MRATITALSLAFVLGGFAVPASAGDDCAYEDHEVKKNDFETPPPAASVVKPQKQG